MKVNANRIICEQAVLHTAQLVLDLEEMKIRKYETYRNHGALRVPYLNKI